MAFDTDRLMVFVDIDRLPVTMVALEARVHRLDCHLAAADAP